MKRTAWLYLVVPIALALDVFTKVKALSLFGGVQTLIPGFLALRVVFNRGILFGLVERGEGDGISPLVHLGWLLGLTAVLWLAAATPAKKRMRHLGFACMIGGALGNGLDRLWHGHVVDFIQVWFLPILNVADLFFLFGAFVVAWDVTRTHPLDQGELHASDPV